MCGLWLDFVPTPCLGFCSPPIREQAREESVRALQVMLGGAEGQLVFRATWPGAFDLFQLGVGLRHIDGDSL